MVLELSQPLRHAQASQIVLTKMFNAVVVQRSTLNPNLPSDSVPPPVDGAPDDRTGAGTRAAQSPVAQPEAAPRSV